MESHCSPVTRDKSNVARDETSTRSEKQRAFSYSVAQCLFTISSNLRSEKTQGVLPVKRFAGCK